MCDGCRVWPLGLHRPNASSYVVVFRNCCHDLCCGVVYLVGGSFVSHEQAVECLGGVLGVG